MDERAAQATVGEAYISGALTALEDAPRTKLFYEVIAEIAEGAKLRAYLPHRVTDPVAAANIEPRTVYEIDRAHVTAARVVIAYAGVPSFGVGIEVELAREHGVPVVVVAERDRPVSRLLLGNPAVVEVVRFADLDGLRRALVAALSRIAALPLDGPRPQVSDDVVVQRFIASLEHARRLPDAEIVALLRVGEIDGEAASAVREAVARGRLFGAGLRDLVGRHALRGVDLAVFVLRDILERSLVDTARVVGLDTRATKRRLAAARARGPRGGRGGGRDRTMARDRAHRAADAGVAAPSLRGRTRRIMSKGQKKQKTTGKLGWRSKKANHGRKPGMGRGKRN